MQRYGHSRLLYTTGALAPIEAIELFNVHCSSLLEFRELLCNRKLGLGYNLDLCLRTGAFGRLRECGEVWRWAQGQGPKATGVVRGM